LIPTSHTGSYRDERGHFCGRTRPWRAVIAEYPSSSPDEAPALFETTYRAAVA
jgi:hypothetical protein